jgi:hypothetical protein
LVEIIINGETFKAKAYDCHLVTVEIGDKTQTLDGADHVEGRKLKRYITAGFTDISRTEASRLLQAVYSNRYLTVTYNDTYTNSVKTGTFILQNDPSMPVKIWRNLKYFEGTVIELKEKGAMN